MPDLRTSAVNQQLDSQYKIETSVKYGADALIILESRGGAGPSARNPDYSKQLFRILQVLQKSGCIIPRIELLSTVAIKNLKDLKLDLHYPILLYGESTIDDVRKMIQSAQQSKGQEPEATGGNGTKRIGIYVKTGPIIAAAGLKAVLD